MREHMSVKDRELIGLMNGCDEGNGRTDVAGGDIVSIAMYICPNPKHSREKNGWIRSPQALVHRSPFMITSMVFPILT